MEVGFEFTCGKRITSNLLYTSDHHLFQCCKKKPTGGVYSCYVKQCSAKVNLDGNKCVYHPEHSAHCHEVQTSTYNTFKTEQAIKDRCKLEPKKPRVIYNEECVNDTGNDVQYDKRRRHLHRIQSNKIPKSPNTTAEVLLYFALELISIAFGKTQDKANVFYSETVNLKNFGYSIFVSENFLNNLPSIRNYRIDGTFKCVPRGPFKQLLIISVDMGNHVRPSLHIFNKMFAEQ